ncbi:MAG: hypothetical protein GY938_05345 [Ketobacter sp.]|nr:hypothetical protein [Ketobacter sp.]
MDLSKAFDTVNIHTLLNKITKTDIPNTIIKFIANYLKDRKAFTTYNKYNSTRKLVRTGVPQGSVLSPSLFNIYMSDIPTPPENVHIITYADDITIASSNKNHLIAQRQIQYLHTIHKWTL